MRIMALRNCSIAEGPQNLTMGQVYEVSPVMAEILLQTGDARLYGGPTENRELVPIRANKDAHALASKLGIDLSEVEPTGKGDRVTLADVKKVAKARGLG